MQFEPETSGESLDESLARLRADSAVEYAEPDHRRYAQTAPNDPLYSGQWFLKNASTTPSAINAEGSWGCDDRQFQSGDRGSRNGCGYSLSSHFVWCARERGVFIRPLLCARVHAS